MDINKLKSPPFEVRIDLPWSILQKINKVLRFAREGSLKIRSDGKVCWLKSENSEGGNEIEMNFDNKWLPKKPFQYMLQNKYFEVPKGDYILHLSEHGMSKWVSADGKYIYYIELEPKENWFIKKQTKGPLTAKSEILPIKVLTGKEYKIASGYAEKVNKSWRKSIDAIIETGELLDQAMKKFKKDEMMWSTFMNSLPFGLRAVEMLINIAKNKSLLLHPEIYKALPASWGTLYALVNIGPSQPIIIYQNNHGEISQAPKSGFDKTTVTKEDFLLRGIEGKDALIRPEMTKADAIKYKAEIDSLYFPKLSNETFLTIELEAGKTVTTSALKKIKAAVQGLIKGKPLLLIENANVIKK